MPRFTDPMPSASASGSDDTPKTSSTTPPASNPVSHRLSGTRIRARETRILLADNNSRTRDLLRPRLLPLATELHEALDGAALERALLESGPYQLVVASARLPEPSALQVLARVRRAGIRTPFIVVASLSTHERRMRVFVSDAEGTVLSSRVLDDENLAVLVTRLIEDGAAPG